MRYSITHDTALFFSTGTLRNVVCALHIGDADNLDNFIGEIDEVS